MLRMYRVYSFIHLSMVAFLGVFGSGERTQNSSEVSIGLRTVSLNTLEEVETGAGRDGIRGGASVFLGGS